MKNRIRETVLLLSALLAIAGIPALAQDAAGTVALATPSAPASPGPEAAFLGRARRPNVFPARLAARLRGFLLRAASQRAGPGPLLAVADRDRERRRRQFHLQRLRALSLERLPRSAAVREDDSRATVFVFFTPTFSFGNNVPQFKYTASMAPIAFERSVGVGIELPKNFEFRVTQHQVDWLGRYNNNVGPGRPRHRRALRTLYDDRSALVFRRLRPRPRRAVARPE